MGIPRKNLSRTPDIVGQVKAEGQQTHLALGHNHTTDGPNLTMVDP